MEFNDKEIRRMSILLLLALVTIAAFLVVRPILLSIVGGLILAYIFFPFYKRVLKIFRNRTLSAYFMTLVLIIIVVLPLWFIIPVIVQQAFQFFNSFQGLNVSAVIRIIFPTASDQFVSQTSLSFDSFIGKVVSNLLSSLSAFLLDLSAVLLHAFLIGFVFFFTLRDHEELVSFVSKSSPFKKEQGDAVVKQFKKVTDSIIYGQIVVGIIQGITAGLGFIFFGIPNALVLTIFAVVLSIIPFIGPALTWVPVGIYLLSQGNTNIAIGFFLYNIIITSTIDNFLRPYIVSRRSQVSSVIVLIGMIGGLFVFGIIGFILGPLILVYFITFLKAYKEKTLSDLFKD